MIIMPGEQGTDEWLEMRLGIPTASNFDKIVTASCRPSSQADDYLARCIGEWVTGEGSESWGGNDDTERGHLFEDDARATLIWEKDLQIEQCAFVYKDETQLVGCSPDGLEIQVAEKKTDQLVTVVGGCEIKCPRAPIHVGYLYLNECPKKYLPQVQGSMWVCDVDHWYFESYHQSYEPLIMRVERDETWSKAFDKYVGEFIERMLGARLNPRFIEMRERRLEETE